MLHKGGGGVTLSYIREEGELHYVTLRYIGEEEEAGDYVTLCNTM